MADKQLSALTAASALADADLFYVTQGGNSRKATGTQLRAFIGTPYEAGPITPPTTADLATWVNQGTSSVADVTGGMALTIQADGSVHGREKAAPAAPFDIYCRVEPIFLCDAAITTGLDSNVGILLRDNSDGELLLCGVRPERDTGGNIAWGVIIQRWTNATTFSASPVVFRASFIPLWVRVNVTSTTVTMYVSPNGKYWVQVPTTESIATFVDTVDRIGVGGAVDADNDTSVALYTYFSTTAPS